MECVCSFVWEGKDKGRIAAERKKERKKETQSDPCYAASSSLPSPYEQVSFFFSFFLARF